MRIMPNNYPHQSEMNLVLNDLKEIVNVSHTPPFETIDLYHRKMLSISSEDTDYSMLNDVEEAAVIKRFGSWYQKQYSNEFPNGRKR